MINDGEIEVDSSSRTSVAASNSISLLEEETKSTLLSPLGEKSNDVEKKSKRLLSPNQAISQVFMNL